MTKQPYRLEALDSIRIQAVNNGWVLTIGDDPVRSPGYMPEAAYVFNSAAEMSDWLRKALLQLALAAGAEARA